MTSDSPKLLSAPRSVQLGVQVWSGVRERHYRCDLLLSFSPANGEAFAGCRWYDGLRKKWSGWQRAVWWSCPSTEEWCIRASVKLGDIGGAVGPTLHWSIRRFEWIADLGFLWLQREWIHPSLRRTNITDKQVAQLANEQVPRILTDIANARLPELFFYACKVARKPRTLDPEFGAELA